MKNETKWLIDLTHSEIAFTVKHLMIANVRGTFRKFEADVHTAGIDFTTATIDLWIDPSSIHTGDEKRDEHLKSADFFDVMKTKEITFVSDMICKPDANGNHEMWGKLSIRGISKLVQFNVVFGGIIHDPWGNERAGFTVTGTLYRKDWDMNWNTVLDAGGLMIGEEVKVICEIQLIKAKDEVATMKLENAEGKK